MGVGGEGLRPGVHGVVVEESDCLRVVLMRRPGTPVVIVKVEI